MSKILYNCSIQKSIAKNRTVLSGPRFLRFLKSLMIRSFKIIQALIYLKLLAILLIEEIGIKTF
jgi:hypothetical protein